MVFPFAKQRPVHIEISNITFLPNQIIKLFTQQ